MSEVLSLAGLAKWLVFPVRWLSSRHNRQRASGARVEVLTVVLCREPAPSVVAVQSVYDGLWMLPQEGVDVGEALLEAAARGMREECGSRLVSKDGSGRAGIHYRGSSYVGTVMLPEERWGERSVATGVEDGPLGLVQMRKKAYWAAFFVVEGRDRVDLRPNQIEVSKALWLELDECWSAFEGNRTEKRDLLRATLQLGAHQLMGHTWAAAWR